MGLIESTMVVRNKSDTDILVAVSSTRSKPVEGAVKFEMSPDTNIGLKVKGRRCYVTIGVRRADGNVDILVKADPAIPKFGVTFINWNICPVETVPAFV